MLLFAFHKCCHHPTYSTHVIAFKVPIFRLRTPGRGQAAEVTTRVGRTPVPYDSFVEPHCAGSYALENRTPFLASAYDMAYGFPLLDPAYDAFLLGPLDPTP